MEFNNQIADNENSFAENDIIIRVRKDQNLMKFTENNTKHRDGNGKIIFENAIFCAQFLNDYMELPFQNEIKPEDIEDVTERYTPLFTSEREADVVKKIT